MVNNIFDKLTENYPFLSLISYAGNEHIGIIQNQDTTVTTIYDFGEVVNTDLKMKYLDLGETWWWESNRSIPINLFLKHEWEPFKFCLKTFSNKDVILIHGPVCSLKNMRKTRGRRRSITLVRKVD